LNINIQHYFSLKKSEYHYQTSHIARNSGISANQGRGGETSDCALLLSRDILFGKFD